MTQKAVQEPFITVVMPVRNEARFIENTLNSLLEQEYPADRFEVLVADGFSDDGTRETVNGIARKNPHVRLLDNPGIRSSAGRNVGFRNGHGDFFVVVDGHCYIPDNQFLQNHAICFAESGADCLSRPQPLDPPDLSPFQKAVSLARASRLGHGGGSLIYSGYEGFVSPVSNGAAYKRHVFEQIGYVDESFDACEDVEFNVRVEKAGFRTYMSSSLEVKYYPRENLSALFRQMTRYGAGRYRLFRKHPESLSLSTLAPPVFTLVFLFAVLLTTTIVCNVLPLRIGFLPGFLFLFYFSVVFVQSVSLCLKANPRYIYVLTMVFFVIHFGLGLGFLMEVAGRQTK